MHYTLNDGNVLPAIGFGTYKLTGTNGVRAMVGALNLGYRLLDSAFNYENEGAVGEAVRQSGIPRSQLIVASKLPGRHHRYQEAIDTIEESLYRAGFDYYERGSLSRSMASADSGTTLRTDPVYWRFKFSA